MARKRRGVTGPLVLSYSQARALEQGRRAGQRSVPVSPDLGLSTVEVRLEDDRAAFPGGQWLSWEEVKAISRDESVCYVVGDEGIEKIQRFGESLNRVYGLMPTRGAPTLLVSGIPMHRVKDTDPHRDTRSKIRAIRPLAGQILDTCTGLGYTAIEAAKGPAVDELVTIELDPTVLDVARLNPWSRSLFGNPKIRQIVGDTFEEIEGFEEGRYHRIVHDPPMFSLAGELYSGEFYQHLYRVLTRKGRLFHYVGDPDSRSGRNVTKGVVRRLQEAGFRRVVRKPWAFGLVAYK
jgi:predicted methyltransferase